MMRSVKFLVAAGTMAVAVGGASGSFAQSPEDGNGKSLFVRACSDCHDINTTIQRRMSESEWLAMVNRMVDLGAKASPEEIEAIAAYLNTYYGLTPRKPASK
ncbi:MAG: cytochrome c [Steroidobacteraceae bacterium]